MKVPLLGYNVWLKIFIIILEVTKCIPLLAWSAVYGLKDSFLLLITFFESTFFVYEFAYC